MKTIRLAAIGCIISFAIGCGGGNATVEGTVTVDGAPVGNGTIAFIPASSEGKKAGEQIADGKYALGGEFSPAPGNYKVEIRWNKPTGKKVFNADLNQQMDVFAEGLPEKFHKNSELKATLKPGKNKVDFSLSTK